MAILESALMEEFISFIKANRAANSSVNQRRRRLRQLVAMVRGVADATERRAALRGGSLAVWLHQLRMEALRGQAVLDATSDACAVVGAAKRFLAGLRALFVGSAEVDRLTQAVEELERLAGPGGDLDIFIKVLQLEPAPPAAMDTESSGPAMLPKPGPGAKRKRAHSASSIDGDSTLQSPSDEVDEPKRRILAWRQPPSSTAASLKPPMPHRAQPRTSARAVAMAMARVRGRFGKPARRRWPAGSPVCTAGLPIVGRRLSLISLQ